MPNWVRNTLTCDKKYRNHILNTEGEVDFNILVPMPDAIRNTVSDSYKNIALYAYLSDNGKKADANVLPKLDPVIKSMGLCFENYDKIKSKYNETVSRNKNLVEELYNRGKIAYDCFEQYGSTDWYDWSIQNWSCKWNASDTTVSEKGNTLVIEFDTPWSDPEGWIRALAAQNVPFDITFVEEDSYIGCAVSHGDGKIDYFEGRYDNHDASAEELIDKFIKDLGEKVKFNFR